MTARPILSKLGRICSPCSIMETEKEVKLFLNLGKGNKPTKQSRFIITTISFKDYDFFVSTIAQAVADFVGFSVTSCMIQSIFNIRRNKSPSRIMKTSQVLMLNTEKDVHLGIQYSE